MTAYSVQERFTPTSEGWVNCIEWSGRANACEIITFDGMLCPSPIDDLTAEDWSHNLHTDNSYHLFRDYKYLLGRIDFDICTHNVLELTAQPQIGVIPSPSFQFCGYDIMDSDDSVSVLLNCGAFPDIFSPLNTNSFGLVPGLDEALRIANDIREANPDEHHCRKCRVWGISRYINAG